MKDGDGSRLFYEPLVSFDPDGNFVPVLAVEVPTVQNGMVARDGLSVTVRLKKGVHWHDGKPFTADDVVFTWEYAADPATLAVSAGSFQSIARVDKLDTHTVKIVYKTPTPFWASAFRGVIAQARLRALQGGKIARGPGQPQARRHRTLPHRRLQARRRRARGDLPGRITSRTGPSSTVSR